MDLVTAANLWKMHINNLHNYKSQLYVHLRENGVQSIFILGILREEQYRWYIMIIIHVYTIIGSFTQLMELIVGRDRSVQTWNGSSLWVNQPYTVNTIALLNNLQVLTINALILIIPGRKANICMYLILKTYYMLQMLYYYCTSI